MKHRFVGFGFGPIQAGLCLAEAFAAGRFDRLVVAEVDANMVHAVRSSGGRYFVNIAHDDHVDVQAIEGVEMLNPLIDADRSALVKAIEDATDIFTCLPSVQTYTAGGPASVAALLAEGLSSHRAAATLIYTAENNNHAAEILQTSVQSFHPAPARPVQYLNTVIGKMSQVLADPDEIRRLQLTPITPALSRAFLVESFNRILVSRITLAEVRPGITVFGERDDLLPFEEAKLYGHNAIHALLAYLGARQGCSAMTELKTHPPVMALARRAFLEESGAALIKKYRHVHDPLFTSAGYAAYADDLLERMTNPFLHDAVARAARDPQRKLGWEDRLVGTMRLALAHDIAPDNMAVGALAACYYLLDAGKNAPAVSDAHIQNVLQTIWPPADIPQQQQIINHICRARDRLFSLDRS